MQTTATKPATRVTAPGGTYDGIDTGRGLAFLGVPYAEQPAGLDRFRPPRPLREGGTFDATRPGNACIQQTAPAPDWAVIRGPQTFGEDCLNLNLWTPAADARRRPVIVHAFGGSFQHGSATGGHLDGGAFTAANDVVLVRPNLRTGALGFLHLADAFPDLNQTNRSMLDLAQALRWIRANAAAFGGDPDNITLAGMSSGAFTAAALFGAPGGADLFDKCWLMSGYASRILDPANAARIAADFLDRAGIAPGDDAALAALPADRILDLQMQVVSLNLAERSSPGGRTLGIVQDGTSMPRHPRDALAAGAGARTPMVVGRTAHEARLWYARGLMGDVDADRLRLTVSRFETGGTDAALAEIAAACPGASPIQQEEWFLTDRIYRLESERTAAAQRAGGGQAWTYQFAWTPSGAHADLGAAHGFDEPFVYGLHDPARVPVTQDDPTARPVASRMEAALARFAHEGDPGWSDDPMVFAP